MNKDVQFRVFRTPPGQYLVEEFLTHIRQTGEPETFPGLHPGPIVKTEPFLLLRPFEIDRRKRPDGNLAPCPMCQPNKYLRGSLIYLTNLKAIAAIGHCCADKDNIVAASREYRERTRRDVEHDYLLAHLPLIPAQLAVVQQARPAASEAERIYRNFRRAGRSFQRPLRLIKKSGGLLAHDEQMQTRAEATGPASFRAHVKFQKIEFGFLRGMIALTSDYHPVRELDQIVAALRAHSCPGTAMLEPQSRHAATVQVRQAGITYANFQRRITDFCQFFTQQNIQLLNRWASHPVNPDRFEASLTGHRCTFRRPGEFWSVSLDPVLWAHDFPWPRPLGD